MAVVDASVYVALVHAGEPGHADCWDWLESAQTRGEPLRAPNILAAEVASAVSRGNNNPELAHQIVMQLLTFNIVELLPITAHLAGRAATIAANHQIPGCDSIYVALADETDDVLVTLDRQQLERGAALTTTRTPAEAHSPH